MLLFGQGLTNNEMRQLWKSSKLERSNLS